MRWFKHMTNSSLDEKLMRLRDQFGVEGYGVYWLVLEAIARECTAKNNKFFLELPPKSWRKITEISPKKFQLFLIFSEKLGLFSVNFSKNLIRVECPNLLKYRGRDDDRLPPYIWSRIRQDVFEYDNYECQYCGARDTQIECDHIIPISRGGTNEFDNLITACKKCNREKRDKTLTEWLGNNYEMVQTLH